MKNIFIKILFWSFGISGVLYLTFCSPSVVHVMESPDGKYIVNISQERALHGGRDFYIDATTADSDEVVFDKSLILSSEWMETGYRGYYPNFHWLAPNILRLGTFGERQGGLIEIHNSTNVKIKYLIMSLPDAYMRTEYVMFDIKQNSKIGVKGEPNNFCGIDGEFANGKKFVGRFNYSVEGEKRTALRIFVENTGVKFKPEQAGH